MISTIIGVYQKKPLITSNQQIRRNVHFIHLVYKM
jgi:hypothetical protein